jgi:hypothetical protein
MTFQKLGHYHIGLELAAEWARIVIVHAKKNWQQSKIAPTI